MCAACELYEVNLLRQRIAARIRRERLRAEAAPAGPAERGADLQQPDRPADGAKAFGATA